MENTEQQIEKRKTLRDILMECSYFEEVDKETGEVTVACDESVELTAKVDSVGYVYNRMKAELELAKQLKKAWDERVKSMESAIENFEDRVKWQMESIGMDKVQGTLTRISFRASTRVDAPDVNLLPKEFVRTKIEMSADKVAIKEAIKNGAIIAGASLVSERNIAIK